MGYKTFTTREDHTTPVSSASKRAAPMNEREPLIACHDTESGRVIRKPNKLLLVLAVAALYLVAGTYVLSALVYYWGSAHVSPAPLPTISVAIIGAGTAGIAAAQHLQNSPTARNVRFNITIYESQPVIGGALAIHYEDGSLVYPNDDLTQSPLTAEDITGSALVWDNTLFTQDSQKLLGDKIDFFERDLEQIGYFRGDTRIASAVRPYRKTPTLTWLKLLWTYGSSVGRGNDLAQDGSLRSTIHKVPLSPDIETLFRSLGVSKPLQQRASDMLNGRGISSQYSTDILGPQVQRAYGQTLDQVTGLTAMMAAAREESANSYGGGDFTRRLQSIVSKLDMNVRTSTRVIAVKYLETDEKKPGWLIRHESVENGGSHSSIDMFDKVIMAAVDLDIGLENANGSTPGLLRHYDVDANFDENSLRETDPFIPVLVGFFISDKILPPMSHDDGQGLFLGPWHGAGMRELALVREIVTQHDFSAEVQYLYRVLSDRSVIKEFETRGKISWSYETKIEKAYPILFPIQRYPPFKLPWASGFWWTSIIQRAGTSIDLNWLAGKVVAQDLIKEISSR
ncbi:hypothetical protein F4808DRAFT_454136 [Astrocystis sublimbata]|nr:hypothetical protein F4808DRAFT_454136 [Astrocystis sublimbata]